MWFKRKPKNRRLGREQVLDVKLRSSQVRAARTRMTAVSVGTIFATIFGLYMLYRSGEWALNRLVYQNKAYAITELDVQTDGVIAVDQLRRWAGVKPRENLLAIDLARVKRDLELIPLIHSVAVERIMPHTLRISITEREPIAQVNVPQPRPNGGVGVAVYNLDADGYVMLPLDPRQRATPASQGSEALPVVAVGNASELQPGRRITAPQVQAALSLITAFEQSPMAGLVDLRRVDASSPEVLVVKTEQGNEVTFGLTGLEQQLRRWHSIFSLGQQNSNTIASLDLAVSNNIPIRWLEGSPILSATPKPAKTPRAKKRHV
jgi:cell division septal protein FtsQ